MPLHVETVWSIFHYQNLRNNRRRMKSRIIFFTFVFLLLALLTGCRKKEIKKADFTESIPVKIMKVELKDISETLDYIGNIKAQDEVFVYSKVSGKISEKIKDEGSLVEKGEPICYIDRDEVGLKFEPAPVESPLKGIVGRIFIDIGSNVTAQTQIALVVNMDTVKISLDIPEKYLPEVSIGQEARAWVDAYPGEEFNGTLTQISPVVDLSSRTAPVEITIPNSRHFLKSGMFAKIILIIASHKNIPVILKEAVMGKEPNLYVYAIEGQKAVSKKITLGIYESPYFEVKEGLIHGDNVVVMGQQRLYDNAPVIIENNE